MIIVIGASQPVATGVLLGVGVGENEATGEPKGHTLKGDTSKGHTQIADTLEGDTLNADTQGVHMSPQVEGGSSMDTPTTIDTADLPIDTPSSLETALPTDSQPTALTPRQPQEGVSPKVSSQGGDGMQGGGKADPSSNLDMGRTDEYKEEASMDGDGGVGGDGVGETEDGDSDSSTDSTSKEDMT